jgi:hypothetical protein
MVVMVARAPALRTAVVATLVTVAMVATPSVATVATVITVATAVAMVAMAVAAVRLRLLRLKEPLRLRLRLLPLLRLPVLSRNALSHGCSGLATMVVCQGG